jgi:hypothetical protein
MMREARRATKARLAQMERVQEQEAYAMTVMGNTNEYGDNYDDQYDGLDSGGELGGGDGKLTMLIWIRFVPTIEQQHKQRRKINFGRNLATQIDRNRKQIMRQKQKCTAAQTRAKAVKELVPMARIFPLKKVARRLERNLSRAKVPLTEQLPSLPPTETLETPLVAAFKEKKE